MTGADIKKAAAILRRGGLIAFPTDTVYGLGTNALRREGFRRIYALKGRDPRKPLPVLVESLARAEALAHLDPRARALARAFWPGPLTLVLKTKALGRRASGADTIGLRVPDHAGVRALIRAAGAPLAATSANRSRHPECRSAEEVASALGKDIDFILDGGTLHGTPSTVVDLTGPEAGILRWGQLPEREIWEVLKRTAS